MADLDDMEWGLFADLAGQRYGARLDATRRISLAPRLAARRDRLGLPSSEYLRLIQLDRGEELAEFEHVITNGETYFFREPRHLEILSGHVAPRLFEAIGPRPLRILCAGCSTGEEAYSISISLQNTGLELLERSWAIDACDLSRIRLEQARAAVYEAPSLRACDAAVARRCFAEEDARYRLRDVHRRGVRFFLANLAAAEPSVEVGRYDVIFCRNVLIYFTEAALRRTLGWFYRILEPGGYLFLGTTESLFGITDDFEPTSVGGGIVYLKAKRDL